MDAPCSIYHWHDSNTRTCYHVWKVWGWTLQNRWDQQSRIKSGCFYISTWPGAGGHDQRGGEERSDIFQGHAWHNLPSSPPLSPPPLPFPLLLLLLLLHLFSSSLSSPHLFFPYKISLSPYISSFSNIPFVLLYTDIYVSTVCMIPNVRLAKKSGGQGLWLHLGGSWSSFLFKILRAKGFILSLC